MKKSLVLKILLIGAIVFILGGINIKSFATEEGQNQTQDSTQAEQDTTPVIPEKTSITTLRNYFNLSIHTYTGKARTPKVKLYDGSKTLTEGTDYTVKYSNNTKVGKAKIVVKGKGDYTGTITKYFYIAPKKQKITSIVVNDKYTKATISWEKDTMATGYKIYMAESKNGKYKWIKTINKNKITSYTKTKLSAKKNYYFKVVSYKIIDNKHVFKLFSEPKTNTGLLAEVSLTSYTSGSNRNHNLKTACKKISGKILKPGQVFNWFKVVGPADKAHGYKQAIVYANKKHKLGYGGGVCQVSTTLYQTSKKLGLKILERHLHSLPVSYTKWGNDATVSYGVQNLRIQNNKKYTIKIVMSAKGGTTTCKIYKVN